MYNFSRAVLNSETFLCAVPAIAFLASRGSLIVSHITRAASPSAPTIAFASSICKKNVVRQLPFCRLWLGPSFRECRSDLCIRERKSSCEYGRACTSSTVATISSTANPQSVPAVRQPPPPARVTICFLKEMYVIDLLRWRDISNSSDSMITLRRRSCVNNSSPKWISSRVKAQGGNPRNASRSEKQERARASRAQRSSPGARRSEAYGGLTDRGGIRLRHTTKNLLRTRASAQRWKGLRPRRTRRGGNTNRRRRFNPYIQALENLDTYHALVVEKVTGNVRENLCQQRGGGRDEDDPEGEIQIIFLNINSLFNCS
ncbi:unnamed protein product [Trichogramma brassicae]|uniref:Uncharacterized protein n=1 Tax=Trichogramma brassicae TaxID=86971 RepID=A0A6H5I2P2_9HYME|nr:unnamed protein product [Trichogramma brassicae]